MIAVLTQNVLICPKCKAGMHKSFLRIPEEDGSMGDNSCFVCNDCHQVYILIDKGQTDNELLVTDTLQDYYNYTRTNEVDNGEGRKGH